MMAAVCCRLVRRLLPGLRLRGGLGKSVAAGGLLLAGVSVVCAEGPTTNSSSELDLGPAADSDPGPDPALSAELLTSMSVTMEMLLQLLDKTTHDVTAAQREYAKSIHTLIALMKYNVHELGQDKEDKIWQLIIQTRSEVKEKRQWKELLERVYTSVEKLIVNSAEVAYLAGDEAASKLSMAELAEKRSEVREAKQLCEEAERDLIKAEVSNIYSAMEHQEKLAGK